MYKTMTGVRCEGLNRSSSNHLKPVIFYYEDK
jgi:hypothetical protein